MGGPRPQWRMTAAHLLRCPAPNPMPMDCGASHTPVAGLGVVRNEGVKHWGLRSGMGGMGQQEMRREEMGMASPVGRRGGWGNSCGRHID